ncbi:FAD-dependent oxidoreductase [Streptomyces europaeiscabiei]|uniref:FAD-dependent oxidoreductase n=1 Tax=Streptomyces europaeiscabiei TaxID=146819 RepID=UPI000AA17D74|nr:FAD-dependent oxidoreductase [Streptomyces europaeiscabiei]MDX3671038.1 NAD(P)-binding protein [Streptomyces europaeiscabiei]MDX3783049.1 NAD(P)-binding protein [Streptomyces europaeiscabiei]MDX3834037.1 NAD(P)-binding protein [Streptomyces europaeiscabiei]MDX3861262.1 NAD(P)-binding protein [Streptomyces europaeiscabiei]MDX3868685.1 NAD(P)-binding protein [Streptomyces europaeiscabiei]
MHRAPAEPHPSPRRGTAPRTHAARVPAPTPLTVIGGGFAGLTAAITAAEAGAKVTVYEAHHTLGGRARTAEGPYRTNEGPHALYSGGPHWTWLGQRDLIGPLAPLPPLEAARLRLHHKGALRRTPPFAMLKLLRPRRTGQQAPVDVDFLTWATEQAGEEAARAAANYSAVALFHHDPGSLSAAFVQERLRRATKLPPEAHYPRGGWASVIDRMAARAWNLGVRMETLSRVDTLDALTGNSAKGRGKGTGPIIVATSLAAARRLLKDDSLTWPSGRTALVDLAVRTRRGDAFAVSDLDAPGWIERFTAQDRTLAPAGEQLLQGQFPIGPHESRADGVARAERLLDLGFPGWRDRVTRRREATANGRTGAVDPPGTSWRDRPAVDRGDGVYLAGDQVAAPGVLSEVSFNSALAAVSLALGRSSKSTLDLKHA